MWYIGSIRPFTQPKNAEPPHDGGELLMGSKTTEV